MVMLGELVLVMVFLMVFVLIVFGLIVLMLLDVSRLVVKVVWMLCLVSGFNGSNSICGCVLVWVRW